MDPHYTELPEFFENIFPKSRLPRNWNKICNPAAQQLRDMEILNVSDKTYLYQPLVSGYVPNAGRSAHYAISSCSALNEMLCGDGLPYVVKATGFNPEGGEDNLKPDLCLYPISGDAATVYGDVSNPDAKPHVAKTSWAFVVSLIEIQTNPNAAPCNFDDEPFTVDTDDKLDDAGPKFRAQMASYATELQRRQHRNFVFTAFIQQDSVRFMRWDRTGVLVSPAYNYTQNPEPLLRFIYLLAMSSPVDQGYNVAFRPFKGYLTPAFHAYKLSMQAPDGPEANKWYRKLGEGLGMDNDATTLNPLHEIELDAQGRHRYIIGAPLSVSHAPIGRATKVFAAYDVTEDRLVCMKVYWCAEGTRTELEVYRTLMKAKVPNIATPLAGGRLGEMTRSQDFTVDRSNRRPARRFLFCFVTQELGRHLDTYDDQGVLFNCLQDALNAHKFAYEAGVLHRDISEDNILIDIGTKRGFLNDWDLAKDLNQLENEATQDTRTGTWMFMSAPLLKWPRKPNTLSDDMESLIHVTTIMGLRFCLHDKSLIIPGTYEIDTANARKNTDLSSYTPDSWIYMALNLKSVEIRNWHRCNLDIATSTLLTRTILFPG